MTGLTSQITEIREMDLASLRQAWRRWYRTPPPRRLSRDLLVRGIAYRIQEDAHGGLSNATRRRLRKMAKGFAETGRAAPDTGPKLRPGARLVREWRGKIHVVTVTEDGFEYGGRTHPSLTAVARQITGAHWSGPRFFGLRTSSETAHGVNHA